jgi:hypothetical protein
MNWQRVYSFCPKMKNLQYIGTLLLIAAFNSIPNIAYCQINSGNSPQPTAAINVFNYQNMEFGAFAQGSGGGTVTISPDARRSATGNITLLNFGALYFPAIFEIEVPKNSMVSMVTGQDAILNGSNGGTISLKIGLSDPLSPFVTSVDPPGRTKVAVGGTLTVGNLSSSPPGNYSGEFQITFIVE